MSAALGFLDLKIKPCNLWEAAVCAQIVLNTLETSHLILTALYEFLTTGAHMLATLAHTRREL